MAKKKQKKSLLPKRIAGVKVPKSVRKGQLGALLTSRAGQALIAEAVMAAGAIAGAKKASQNGKVRSFADHAATRLQDLGGEAGRSGKQAAAAGGALAYALGEAARSFVDALNRGGSDYREDPAPATWTADTDERPKTSKKKPVSYEAGPV